MGWHSQFRVEVIAILTGILEAARILGESIDYSRQAEAMALRLRTTKALPNTRPVAPVEGVTPAGNGAGRAD